MMDPTFDIYIVTNLNGNSGDKKHAFFNKETALDFAFDVMTVKMYPSEVQTLRGGIDSYFNTYDFLGHNEYEVNNIKIEYKRYGIDIKDDGKLELVPVF